MVSAEAKPLPKAVAFWERICREANYPKPLDYAVVLTVAGWSELDRSQLPEAAVLFGSLAIHHQIKIDVKTAKPEQIRELAANQAVRFVDTLLSATKDNVVGVLVYEDEGITAYTRFRQSRQYPERNERPCEMHVLGQAPFFDAYFDPNAVVREVGDVHFVGQMNASFDWALYRPVARPDNVKAAQILLPQYTYIIKSFN
jgi:hypothetical protein